MINIRVILSSYYYASIHINSLCFPIRLKKLEKGFVLDGVPLSKLGNDEIGRTNPTMNIGIPQYLASKDKHCRYLLGSSLAHASMMGSVNDKFLGNSAAKEYMESRRNIGAGNSNLIHDRKDRVKDF